MTVTIGTALLINVAIGLACLLVGAAWGKRIGLKGGTVKGSVSAEISKLRNAANAKLQAEIKAVKEKAKEQI